MKQDILPELLKTLVVVTETNAAMADRLRMIKQIFIDAENDGKLDGPEAKVFSNGMKKLLDNEIQAASSVAVMAEMFRMGITGETETCH